MLPTDLDLKAKKTPNLNVEDLEPVQLNTVSVFEYMIGNTDFSVVKRRRRNRLLPQYRADVCGPVAALRVNSLRL